MVHSLHAEIPAFVCVDGWNETPDASGNAADSSLRGFAQEGLQQMKDHLDWIDPGNTARRVAPTASMTSSTPTTL